MKSLYELQVGDIIHANLFRDKKILFQTKDHSHINWLIDRGELTPAEAVVHPKKNMITRCIAGTRNPTKADVLSISDFKTGDFLLLCTDGVLETWNNEALAELMESSMPLQIIADKLTAQCSALSDDNFTGILIKLIS